MRLFISILAGILAISPALAFDDPKALVNAIYDPYLRGGAEHADLTQFYSAHLKELFTVHAQGGRIEPASIDDREPAPPIDFNPFVDAKHSLLFDLKVSEPMVLADSALVTVSFHNFDHPTLLSLALVKESDGWKVDDVTSTGGEANWMLSWLLLYDPWAAH